MEKHSFLYNVSEVIVILTVYGVIGMSIGLAVNQIIGAIT